MKVGFYAPLKSPNHPVPSGDRLMAWLLIKALKACGFEVDLMSELRSWDSSGSSKNQESIRIQGEKEAKRLINYYQSCPPPDLLFTYHVYHKAPDWIGPPIAKQLNIPYLVAEASFAPKQTGGVWDQGHQQTQACIQLAKAIVAFNPIDVECIAPLLNNSQRVVMIKPFLEKTPTPPTNKQTLKMEFARKHRLDSKKVWLICVAMMRPGDKLASYQFLAESLQKLNTDNWQLIIIGDGESKQTVQQSFHAVIKNCFFAGRLENDQIFDWLSASDLFVWPAINEAYGLALLESLAMGLPAVAQDYGGVSTIIEHGQTGYVTPPNSVGKYLKSLSTLIQNNALRENMGKAARTKFVDQHRFEIAVEKLKLACNAIFL